MIKLRHCSKITLELLSKHARFHLKAGIGASQTFKVGANIHVLKFNHYFISKGSDLTFMVSGKTAFELPLRYVANSNIAGKTEVSMEFSNLTPSTSAGSKSGSTKNMGDELTEIRFFVPGNFSKLKGSDAGSQKSDDEDEEEISAAQVFHDTIKEKAEIGQVTGDLILSFEEVLVLTPRGRYDMDMFPDFLRLRGKTYDYKVLYQSIARLFLLPKDDQHVLFIVRLLFPISYKHQLTNNIQLGLSTPIRQGQTLYQYLVMQFTREEEITAELNMSEYVFVRCRRYLSILYLLQGGHCQIRQVEEELRRSHIRSRVQRFPSVGWQEDHWVRKLPKVCPPSINLNVVAHLSSSRDGHPGFKANLKAVQGDLFLLERYIFFVSKQPALIEISDIHQVIFSRVGAGAGASTGRTFDLKIVTKSGPEHNFTSINRDEHEITETYLKDKKVRVKNEMVPDADLLLAAVAGDDDDDMQSVISSDSDRGKSGPKIVSRKDDDDSSEEDGTCSFASIFLLGC